MRVAPVAGWLLLALLAAPGCVAPVRHAPAAWSRIGSVEVDTANRQIRAEGFVNMDRGPIELLACGPRGKTHEALLVLQISPVDLQTALLLLGLQPGTDPVDLGVGPPDGPQLDLWVEWQAGGETVRRRAEHLVFHRADGRALPETGWAFTGSQVIDGRFMADAEQSFVATFWDPWAILNLPLPCGGDDTLLQVNETEVPPAGTPVHLRLVPRR